MTELGRPKSYKVVVSAPTGRKNSCISGIYATKPKINRNLLSG
jgi:hypothetical protein